jgi:hypothetical protein
MSDQVDAERAAASRALKAVQQTLGRKGGPVDVVVLEVNMAEADSAPGSGEIRAKG